MNYLIDLTAREQVNKNNKSWKALQAFYKFKSQLLPEFAIKNKRNLGSMEAELIRAYEATHTKEDKANNL